MDPTLRLYAIMRGDLNMTPGKIAAQAGHAFLDAYNVAQDRDPDRALEYRSDGHGTKIVLCAPTLDALHNAYRAASERNLPCALITDSGHIMLPHFDGSPIITALGIGPCTRDQIKSITKKFALTR